MTRPQYTLLQRLIALLVPRAERKIFLVRLGRYSHAPRSIWISTMCFPAVQRSMPSRSAVSNIHNPQWVRRLDVDIEPTHQHAPAARSKMYGPCGPVSDIPEIR